MTTDAALPRIVCLIKKKNNYLTIDLKKKVFLCIYWCIFLFFIYFYLNFILHINYIITMTI